MSVGAEIRFAVVPEWLLDAEVEGKPISGQAVKLYAVLARIAGTSSTQDATAYPSRRYLGGRLGCSVDTIDRLVRELETAGALDVERDRTTAQGDPDVNLYTVRVTQGTAPERQGKRTDTATPRLTDTATPSRTDAALKEKHPEREPMEREKTLAALDDRFAEFYAAYPRHTAKTAAAKAWKTRIKAGADPAELVDKARAFAAWVAAGGVDSPRFVPHPATWLNQGREADELPDPRSMSPPAVNGSRRKYDVTDAWADLEKTIGGNDDGSARVASDLRADVRSLPGS